MTKTNVNQIVNVKKTKNVTVNMNKMIQSNYYQIGLKYLKIIFFVAKLNY